MKLQKIILLIDSLSGLIAGIFVLLLYSYFSAWYNWSREQTLFIGFTNLLYGSYSGFILYQFTRGNLVLNEKITVLILANCIWAGHCFTQVWNHYSNFSIFGSLHLGFEGIYVIVLAYFEARFLLARFLYESNT